MPRKYNQSEAIKIEQTNRHLENITFLKFLKEVREITYRRFVKSSKRSKFLTCITDEINNCKKRDRLLREEYLDPNLVREKEKELQDSINEIRQLEYEVCDNNNFDYNNLLSEDLLFTESDIEKILSDSPENSNESTVP